MIVKQIDEDIKDVLVDASVATIGLYSENAARWVGIIREVWEAREVWDSEEWEGKRPKWEPFRDYSWNLLCENWFGISIEESD